MSWYGLLGILKERNAIRQERESRPPIACPNDGEPLRPVGDGISLRCVYDGWSWPENDGTAIR